MCECEVAVKQTTLLETVLVSFCNGRVELVYEQQL